MHAGRRRPLQYPDLTPAKGGNQEGTMAQWVGFIIGMSIGTAFGFWLRDVLIRARFNSRPVRPDEWPDVPVEKAPAREEA